MSVMRPQSRKEPTTAGGARVLTFLMMSLLVQACDREGTATGLDTQAIDLSFDIEIIWMSGVNDRAREAIEQAVGRWQAMFVFILETPSSLSMKMIGTSSILNFNFQAAYFISI